MDGEENKTLSFAGFDLDIGKRRLLCHGRPLTLNAKAFDVLVFLAENAGRVVTKEEILGAVWEDQFVEEANLAVQISRLRKVLGERREDPRVLVTVPGKGYEFIAEIDSRGRSAPDETDQAEPDTDVAENPIPKEIARLAKRFYLHGLVLAGLLLLTGFAVYRYLNGGMPRDQTVNSIAVLPFTDQDSDAGAEYLGDGLAESVIHSLSGLPDLRVLSRHTAFHYRGREAEAAKIGRELGVETVLTGRIALVGDRLSVSTELISTGDNSVLWGEKFTRKMADLDQLQTEIARAISQKLRHRLSGADKKRLARGHTEDSEAYQLYLLGRYHLNRLTDEGFSKGLEYFRRAVERDPEYALAHVGMADAYSRLSGWNAIAQNEGFPKAKEAALAALRIDKELSEAHTALGTVRLYYEWDFTGAERDYQKAIEIDPNDADARQMYGYFLARMGRFEEALSEMQRAHRLDPLSLEKFAGIGEIYYLQRQYDRAIGQYRQMLEIEPDSGFAHWALGNALVQKKMYREAINAYRKAIPLSGKSPDEPASLAYAHALAGNSVEALLIVEDLKEQSRKTYVSPVIIAFIYIGLGKNEEAFEWLEKGYRERDSLLTLLRVEPIFDPLRTDKRFADLARRVGFST